MRNSLLGIALAAVLVIALFVAAHYGSRPAAPQQPPEAAQNSDPAAAVAALKAGFIGQVAIGDWKMGCGKPRALPRAPQTGNSEGAPPKQLPPPPGWQMPHCNVSQTLRNPKNPSDEVRMMLRRMGFQGVLAVFLRFSPDVVENGDVATLRVDDKNIPMPVRTCGARFCLSIMSVKKLDEPVFLKAKAMTLTFTSRASHKDVVAPFKMRGFAEAVTAMRRMDK